MGIDFKALQFDYEAGVESLTELGKRYGLSPQKIGRRAREWGWVLRANEKYAPPPIKSKKGGVPTKILRLAFRLALLGCNDNEIMETMELPRNTFYGWRRGDSAFAEMIRLGRVQADAAVARALYRRATGFVFDEEQLVTYQGSYKPVKVRKYVVPDVKAQIAWLERRRAHQWAETKNLNVTDKTLRVAVSDEKPVDSVDNFAALVKSECQTD